MKTKQRHAGATLLAAGLGAALLAAGGLAHAVPSAPSSRYASIVIDAATGDVLYERNADLPRYPASLTKIMTLYMVFEALSKKKIALTDKLPVSAAAAGREPSRLGLAPGSTITLEDAIRGMTTKSANDAASVVGEALGKGSEAAFAEAMTAKAKALGMHKTRFRNASGLPDSAHVSTARDLAVLCRAIVRDFPEQYRYFSTSSFEFKGKRYPNQNRFLRSYFGADGIKTGFVTASGHNLAASAMRRDKRLIAVVMGGDTQLWTREHAMRLMDVSYAKIDPQLAFLASNAANAPASPSAYAAPTGSVAVASVAATPVTVATPAGAVTVAAPAVASPAPAATTTKTAPPQGATTSPRPAAATTAGPAAQGSTATAAKAAPQTNRPDTVAAPPASAPATMPRASTPAVNPAPTAPAGSAAAAPAAKAARDAWSVQVGLYRDESVAKKRGEEVRGRMPAHLRNADFIVASSGDGVHLASRFAMHSEKEAREACTTLQRGSVPCVVIPPGRPLIVATN